MDVLVADFSFADLFWILVIFLPMVFLWVFALAHLFRRIGIDPGISIAIWLVVIILLPFLGSIIYLATRPGETKRDRALAREDQSARDKYTPTIR